MRLLCWPGLRCARTQTGGLFSELAPATPQAEKSHEPRSAAGDSGTGGRRPEGWDRQSLSRGQTAAGAAEDRQPVQQREQVSFLPSLFPWRPPSTGDPYPAHEFKGQKGPYGPIQSHVSLPVWASSALPRGHITLTFTHDKDKFSPRPPSVITVQPFPEPVHPTQGCPAAALPPHPISAAALSRCRGLPAPALGTPSRSAAHGVSRVLWLPVQTTHSGGPQR